ncbi:hypothetical protein [Paenibacillus sp. YAF4_2]|uniref:hypothetical protein n=1 Tax=Paenibacillus sp. YAF4_2 TaxID=3233085 RepID=UPI003F990635
MFRFALEWIISIIYLCFSLVLLGMLESSLFAGINDQLPWAWSIVGIANIIIIFVVFRNWFAPRFNWLYQTTEKLPKTYANVMAGSAVFTILIINVLPTIIS